MLAVLATGLSLGNFMTEYLNALASYLPKLIVERANDGRLGGGEPSSEEFAAALLFADVSGFTKLTEHLTAQGPAGTEHLTQVLNLYFGQIIDIVDQWGGDVVKFAGDALIALWPTPDSDFREEDANGALDIASASDPTPEGLGTLNGAGGRTRTSTTIAAERATACALELQERLHHYHVGDGLHLSMKVAVGAGRVTCVQLGGIYDRWEFLVAGSPLEQVGIANGLAAPGEVVISTPVRFLIGSEWPLEPIGEGMYRASKPLEVGRPELAQLPILPRAAASLRRYIPGAIRTRLDANQSDWLGEQRRLSVIFVNLPGFNSQTPLPEADRTMKAMQMALYRFEGSVNKISVDDKGASLIAVLGLPPLGHVDDAERAVRAALAMRRVIADAGQECSVGITSGLAFCGTIGNARRREYTVMGNVVNLSARLMQAAKSPAHGGLLCDETTWVAARGRLQFERLTAIAVKGRSDPIAIFRPIVNNDPLLNQDDLRNETSIGRESEMARLVGDLKQFRERRSGGLLLVKADHGMGKTGLLQGVALEARELGFQVLVGTGDAIDQQSPYRVWRGIFEMAFRPALSHPDLAARRYAVLAALPDDPRLLEVAPLLESILPLGWKDNELTGRLTGEQRADRTRSLLAAVLSDVGTRSPLLIMVHELQWIDSASAALIQVLLKQPVPPVILASITTEGGAGEQWIRDLNTSEHAQLLELSPLGAEAILRVASASLGVASLPDLAARLIVERAEGAPLFAAEMALALRDDGFLDLSDQEARWTGGNDLTAIRLPDTIEGLITARIDRLSPDEQLTIKVASVIGSQFESETLAAIHPVLIDQPAVDSHCEVFDQVLLTARVRKALRRGLQYRFRSELLLQVIYNMMLYSQRRDLHEALAQQYEREGIALAPEMSATMAYHWDRASNDRVVRPVCAQKAVHYYLESGRRAVVAAATREGESAFRRALSLLPQCPEGEEKTSVAIELQLGLGALRMANHGWADEEVAQLFASARALCLEHGRSDLLFRTLRGQWQLAIGIADYERAHALALELSELAGHARSPAMSREALRALGTTNFWRARFELARDQLSSALEIQCAENDTLVSLVQDTEVALRAILAWVHAFLGEAQRATNEASAATALAHEGMPPFSRAFAWGGAMWTSFYLDDAAAALSASAITRDLSLERGFDYLATAAHVVHGWARVTHGDLEGVGEVDAAIAAWRHAGNSIGLPVFLLVLAKTYLAAGQVNEARSVLEDPALIAGLERELWLRSLAAVLRNRATLDPVSVLSPGLTATG